MVYKPLKVKLSPAVERKIRNEVRRLLFSQDFRDYLYSMMDAMLVAELTERKFKFIRIGTKVYVGTIYPSDIPAEDRINERLKRRSGGK